MDIGSHNSWSGDRQMNRIAGRAALLVAALIPLLGLFVLIRRHDNLPATPAGVVGEGGIDPRLINFCATQVRDKRSFVLFKNGTCVIVEDATDPAEVQKRAMEILIEAALPEARFICSKLEEGDYLVTYEKPVFHLRFAEDVEANRDSIETDFRRFLTDAEKAAAPGQEPPFHAKLGLRSRALLLRDAADPKVTRIIAPKAEGGKPARDRSVLPG